MIAIFVLKTNKPWFIASEAIILASLIGSVYFWISFTKPLNLIHSGIESLKDKDFSMRLIQVGQPELDNLIDIYNHMIDRLRYERTLQQEQHFFLDRLILASPAGIIILDYDEKISMMNPSAERYLGCIHEDVKGTLLSSTPSPLALELSTIAFNETKVIQLSGLKKYKVHKSYFTNRGFRNPFLVIEELTDEIYRAELAAYEKVIRIISHEFNNSVGPINSILSSLKFYTRQLFPNDQNEYENVINVAIDRNNILNGFVKRYAEIFKLPPPIKELCNVNDVVYRMNQLFYHELKQRNIQTSLNLSQYAIMVNIDINQFEQVISNILKNAMEALNNNGKIEIITTLSPSKLIIRNNGQPIGAEIQKKLFSPFFSTKKNGQGVGLTLIREILNNHNFTFSLETTSESLTEFHINFKVGTTLS